jgi:hypothetical protein
MNQNKNYTPIIVSVVIATCVGFCLLFLAFITAFSICSDMSIAEVLFPYALYADPTLHDHALVALLLALVQYPAYGLLIGYVRMRRRSAVFACVVILFVAHAVAVAGAQYRVKAMWEYKFSHMQPR